VSEGQQAHWWENKKECTVALGKDIVGMRRQHVDDAAMVAKAEYFVGTIFERLGRFEDAVKSYLESARIDHLVYRDDNCNIACAQLEQPQ
jgi:hypothetical protein